MQMFMNLFLLSLCLSTVVGFNTLSPRPMVSSRLSTKRELSMRWGLKGPQANKPMGEMAEGTLLRDTVPFEIRGISLPLVVFSAGILITASSFAGYFLNSGDVGAISSLGFVYGIPIFLIGLSLWYAEIPPVEVVTDTAGDRAWDARATDTMKKIRQDVTRHRYGDDAHLDSTLEALGLKLPQRKYPKMKEIILVSNSICIYILILILTTRIDVDIC